MKRSWRIKDVHERSAHIFTGRYKGHHLDINREDDGRFYIIVTNPGGVMFYDGWWGDGGKTIDDAIEEALCGSLLITRSKDGEPK